MNTRNLTHEYDVLDSIDAICLTTGNVWCHEPNGKMLELLALDGDIWVTEQGNPADYIVRAGHILRLPGAGLIVVESLTPFACIRACEGEQSAAGTGAAEATPDVPAIGVQV